MSDAMDYYDVQNMIRDARSEIRDEIDRAVGEAVERIGRQIADEVSALQRVIDQRTEHLV